ncbi:Uncharacterised protein [Sphingobacterium mizutaii]|uniref:Uncharacterized protein n=1 Tax=Sphingobacterium mizutaii TaxID=1010 RepID=A0AAJ5C088_9SPHI|nr:hypothetical protein SAMN05192578_101630 [Sphingobacterium mizutaii]SNV49291.1 Uncharacterised protein [Sphingobacterium mizutaii]
MFICLVPFFLGCPLLAEEISLVDQAKSLIWSQGDEWTSVRPIEWYSPRIAELADNCTKGSSIGNTPVCP